MGERGGHVSEKLRGAGVCVLAKVGVSSLLTGGVVIVLGVTGGAISGSFATVWACFLCGLLFLEFLDWDGSLLSVSMVLGAGLVLVGVLVSLAGVGA